MNIHKLLIGRSILFLSFESFHFLEFLSLLILFVLFFSQSRNRWTGNSQLFDFSFFIVRESFKSEHPVRNRTATQFNDISDISEENLINLGKESDSCAVTPSPTCATNTVNVADSRVGNILIDNTTNTYEIYTSGQQTCANKRPNLSTSEVFDDCASLSLASLRMNDIDI